MDTRSAAKVFCDKTGFDLPDANQRLRRLQDAGHLPKGKRGKPSRDLLPVDCASMITGFAGTDNATNAAAACMSRGRLIPKWAEVIEEDDDGREVHTLINTSEMPVRRDMILLEFLTTVITSLTDPDARDDCPVRCVEFLQRLPLVRAKLEHTITDADGESRILQVDQWFAPDLTNLPIAVCPSDGSLFCPRFPVPIDALRVLADIAAKRPDDEIAQGRVLPPQAIEALGTYGERVLH